MVWALIKERQGKVTKLLGRDFALVMIDQLQQHVDTLPGAPEALPAFMRDFRRELTEPDSLFWAPDMQAEIEKRRAERIQRVQQRLVDQAGADDDPDGADSAAADHDGDDDDQ